jgi:HTH-type transcriptional regulator/antitoxin HigA
MLIVTIKPIRTATDLQASKERLAGLLRRPNAGEHNDEIEVLTTLIEQFEQSHSHIDAPTPVMAIKFRMEENGLTPRQLEPFIGSRARVSEVLSGKRQLSIDMIRSLHEGLGIPYEALISDRSRAGNVEQVSAAEIQRLKALGVEVGKHEILSFMPSSLNSDAPLALLRRTRTQRAAAKTDQSALLRWQAAVLQRCETLRSVGTFDRSNFGGNDLRQIAKMSTKTDGPVRAIRELIRKGVAVVVIPPLPGTFLDGAAMASQTGRPVIGLTLRHDRTDSFWFTLLHELAHVALHYDDLIGSNGAFVDDMEIRSEEACEREADKLARDSLIPADILTHVNWGAATAHDDLITISARARVHISVVAGRWQRDHQNYKKFARLIDRSSVRAMLFDINT